MSPLYQHRPTKVAAFQFIDTASAEQICRWAGSMHVEAFIDPATGEARSLLVKATSGPAEAVRGDWIVLGPDGHFYPVPSDVFTASYEPADA